MLAVRIAENNPDRQDDRRTWLEAHQGYLRSGLVQVLQSGPVFEDDAQFGAMLVAEVVDLAELERFSAGDPFVVHGIYRRVRCLRWLRTIG